MENLKNAIKWVLENSEPINEEDCKEFVKISSYDFKPGDRIVRISWFISDCFMILPEKEIEEFCNLGHELIFLDKECKEIYVYHNESNLSEDELNTLKSAVKKYCDDNKNFKWDEYFKDWKIDKRKNKFKYC